MSWRQRSRSGEPGLHLECPNCGNRDGFLQFVDEQVNLVDAQITHIHMLHSHDRRYQCRQCGRFVGRRREGPE